MPSPRENSALWDYVVIGKTQLPPNGVNGVAKVNAPIKWENDKKKSKGSNKTRATTQGLAKSQVEITITVEDDLTLTGESQYDLTQTAIDEIINGCPGPFGIANGATDAARVRDILIDEITLDRKPGMMTWVIKANRWDAPDTTVGSGVAGSNAPAALLAELAAAKAELAKLKSNNIQFTDQIQAAEKKVADLQAKVDSYKTSATKTPDKTEPTKQYYQDQNKGPGQLPLGEIQP